MKLFSHFAAVGFSNSYLIAADGSRDAILVDPGILDVVLLRLIEDNGYYVREILITHGHWNHYGGVKTLLKIYDARVWSARPEMDGIECTVLEGGNIKLSGLDVEVIPVIGHTDDSLMFRIDSFYFTGDVLSAGRTGTTPDNVSRELLFLELNEKLFNRDGHGIVLPGHGPPSTIRAEANLFHKYERPSY